MILSICPNPSVDKFLELPVLESGRVNRSLGERAFPGGKGTHVALAVRELGSECRLAGFWGGPTGRWIQEECKKRGIECFGPQTDEWTRTCLTLASETQNKDTEILEKGPSVTDELMDDFFKQIGAEIRDTQILSVSGSWPPGSPENGYRTLKELADSVNVPLWVDASGKRLEEAVNVMPFGIHINRTEAEMLFGEKMETAEAAQKLLSFCSMAAVTDGENGLFLASGKTVLHASCPVERVISTVGCGDCLLAGLLISQLSGTSPEEMARTAVACGAANCVNPELGMLYKKDVERFMQDTKCRVL